MEDTDSKSEPNGAGKPINLPTKHRLLSWMALLIVILGVVAAIGIYKMEQSKASKVVSQNNSLTDQTAALNKEIKQQNNINNGVVSPGAIYKDPVGGIGLVNGAITLTLPSDWVRVPTDSCTGGTIDSTIVCQDIAAVAPKSLVKSDGTASWSVPIKVFDYASSDGDAKNWFYTKFEGESVGSDSSGLINASISPVNGYSAYVHEYQAFDVYGPAPEYTEAYYAVVHGKYGIVIDVMVQSGSKSSAPGSFDYRNTYQPQIAQMLKTIKFQD